MCSYYWFVDLLVDEGIAVQLVHPLMLKAIAYAKVKTDKADAKTIAQLLRMGMLPRAYIYPKALRPLRDLSRRRADLVDDRSLRYRAIQMLHQQAGLETPSRNAVKKIAAGELAARLEAEPTRLYGEGLIEVNTCLSSQISKMEKHLHERCKVNPLYGRVMEIPGIGKTYGQTILFESGDVNRFSTHRQYVSYARLVPGANNSGQKVRSGHNAKQGNARLKNAFRQAAIHAVLFDRTIRGFYERKLAVVHRKNVAYSIVARKIAIAAFLTLRGQSLDIHRLFGPAALKTA